MARRGKFFLISGIILVIVFVLVYVGVNMTSNLGKTKLQVSAEDAAKRLNKLYSNVAVKTDTPHKGQST